jgi:membrane-bound lytic murein transglycosylase D
MILKKLNKYRLDQWLGTIPIIESGMGYKAISGSGAIGLWQIMPDNLIHYMKKRFRTKNGQWVWTPDTEYAIEKGQDPKVSTDIACKILRHLYDRFGKDKRVKQRDLDKIVVMAYNSGETRISKWLDKKGKSLMAQTYNYYPQLQAIQMILDDIAGPNEFGFR